MPENLDRYPDPVLVLEGPSDVAACLTKGIAAVGRPSNRGGANHLGVLLRDRKCLIVGENDQHATKQGDVIWPGRDGAQAIAQALSQLWKRPVVWTLPPDGVKDFRDWIKSIGIQQDEILKALRSSAITVDESVGVGNGCTSAGSPLQANPLMAVCETVQIFHDGDIAYATIDQQTHCEHWPLQSSQFKRWLAQRFFQVEQRVAPEQSVRDVMRVLEGRALHESPEYRVHLRIAGSRDEIWVDLCDPAWRAVHIDKDGWNVVQKPPVRFRRTPAMCAFPEPERGGSLQALRPFLNTATDADFVLLTSFLVGAMQPNGPFPILVLCGEQGSGKSTTSRLVRRLIDPSHAPLRSEPRSIQDMMIAAYNSRVLAFDNMSHLSAWLSDAVCRISTGGSFGTRTLWKITEESILTACQPVILNSIEQICTRSDLLDRSIQVTLHSIVAQDRMTERELDRQLQLSLPGIFGALLEAVSAAIRNLGLVRMSNLPRMADYAEWVVAAEEALPWSKGEFVRALDQSRQLAHGIALDSAAIAEPLIQFMELNESWQGLASELLRHLNNHSMHRSRADGWPMQPNKLSGALRRLIPDFRAAGIDVKFLPRQGRLGRQLLLRRL